MAYKSVTDCTFKGKYNLTTPLICFHNTFLSLDRSGTIDNRSVSKCDVASVRNKAWGSFIFQQQEGVGALGEDSMWNIQRHLWTNFWPVPTQQESVHPSQPLLGNEGILYLIKSNY